MRISNQCSYFFSKDVDGDATMQTLGNHKMKILLAFEKFFGG